MNPISKKTKKELYSALNRKQSGVFVVDSKLISIEVENNDLNTQNELDYEELSKEIEEYPELKESLSNYLNNPGMKRYTANELKAKRNEKRKQ